AVADPRAVLEQDARLGDRRVLVADVRGDARVGDDEPVEPLVDLGGVLVAVLGGVARGLEPGDEVLVAARRVGRVGDDDEDVHTAPYGDFSRSRTGQEIDRVSDSTHCADDVFVPNDCTSRLRNTPPDAAFVTPTSS